MVKNLEKLDLRLAKKGTIVTCLSGRSGGEEFDYDQEPEQKPIEEELNEEQMERYKNIYRMEKDIIISDQNILIETDNNNNNKVKGNQLQSPQVSFKNKTNNLRFGLIFATLAISYGYLLPIMNSSRLQLLHYKDNGIQSLLLGLMVSLSLALYIVIKVKY